jgi:hypothetical protein
MSRRTRTARICSVEPLDGFLLRVGFDDGTTSDVDLADELWGPVFEPLRNDLQLFQQVQVDRELGTVVWPNGADLDPDVLHGDLPAAASATATYAQAVGLLQASDPDRTHLPRTTRRRVSPSLAARTSD